MQLRGKTALIAGAGRNNGKAIALTFAREGADLILIAKNKADQLDQVARECASFGIETQALLADLSSRDEVNRIVKLGLDRFGKVDVLVCVAAIRPHKHFWEFSPEEWQQIFAINLHATFNLAQALAPGMMRRKSGSIIALGGMASLAPAAQNAAVVASKHGLYGLIKSLALELGPYGVRANLLALSHIENKRGNAEWYKTIAGADPNASDAPARTPLGRTGTPQEVANVALFLASEASSYITGDRIVCGGGRQM